MVEMGKQVGGCTPAIANAIWKKEEGRLRGVNSPLHPLIHFVGGSVKFGMRANFPWENEEFFLKGAFDMACQKVYVSTHNR
jgi:hypothetical protein